MCVEREKERFQSEIHDHIKVKNKVEDKKFKFQYTRMTKYIELEFVFFCLLSYS